jgi:hypothetical protein
MGVAMAKVQAVRTTVKRLKLRMMISRGDDGSFERWFEAVSRRSSNFYTSPWPPPYLETRHKNCCCRINNESCRCPRYDNLMAELSGSISLLIGQTLITKERIGLPICQKTVGAVAGVTAWILLQI